LATPLEQIKKHYIYNKIVSKQYENSFSNSFFQNSKSISFNFEMYVNLEDANSKEFLIVVGNHTTTRVNEKNIFAISYKKEQYGDEEIMDYLLSV
jgi:hypothetical protein